MFPSFASLRKTKASKRAAWAALFVLGVLLVGYGAGGLWAYHKAVSNKHPLPDPEVAVSTSAAPDETTIDPASDYRVVADMPRQIILPTLGVQGFIQKMALADDGSIAVPTNVHMAGWSVQTVKPGEPGLSIIDGHVHGKYRSGIFEKLDQLKPGDQFQIEFGDLSKKTFEVVAEGAYPNDEAGTRLFQKDGAIARELTLITCAGEYNADTKQYSERVLVSAKLVD